MKNILILINTSSKDFQTSRTEVIENTWAKDILDGEYPNIRLWHCAPMSDHTRKGTPHKQLGILDNPTTTCTLPYPDDLLYQFKKMTSALKTTGFDVNWADWIFITNTSTYVNVPLLNAFVQELADDKMIYSSRVISPKYMSGPFQWCFYPEGSGILFNKFPWKDVLLDYTVQKQFIKDDRFNEPDYFRRYKKQIFDTAFGCLINEFIIFASESFDCLKWYSTEYIEYITSTIDPTSVFQDWDGISALKVPEEDWINHITLSVRKDNYEAETRLMETVHERVTEDYEIIHYEIDMRAISEYINSPNTPLITQTEDKPDCCIDDVVRIPYDDYHKWLEENSDIPNLIIDEDGQIRPSDGEKKNGQKVNPHKQHCGMTYAEYFNINFWNHCCWYKNPFTPVCGYGPLNCCEAEQLVYPGATPSHQHDGPKGCGCGCGKHKHPSSYDGVYPDDEHYCYDWNII